VSETNVQPLCEECGRPVDLDAADVVRAMPVMQLETMGMTEWIDGMGVYFHEDCFSGSADFVVVER
jgi:hypothetical protein